MINTRTIPLELVEQRRWLAWRLVTRHGKPTKVPCDAAGLEMDATNPENWVDFEEALARAERLRGGIGFAVGGSGLVGVDLDHCLDESGVIADWALEIVCRLDSYTEITPSGEGLRTWARGSLPGGRRRKGPIEMYDSGRYFTVTGHHLDATPREIRERTAELAALHAELFPPRPERPAHRPDPAPLAIDDRALLERMFASAKGPQIRALFDGNTAGYASGSEADLALCSHLAFWCGGDLGRMDRLFRQSALFDEKWAERADYRGRTLAKALDGSTFYDPSYRTHGDGHANGHAATQGGGEREPGEDDADGPDPEAPNRTDLGNATRLVATHGDDLRYCHTWGRWLVWRGDRWVVDETGHVHRLAHGIVRQLHAEADAEPDDARRKAKKAWAIASESEKRLNAIVSTARHVEGIPVLPGQLDVPAWLLNCANGTLDMRTGRLRPHVRGDLLTKRTSAAFDPDAPCPLWEAFLDRVMGGDGELVAFLRRAVGYALTGDVSEHALFFLYGRGRNGKSTFLNTVQHVLGDYAITVNADLITVSRQEDHPTGLADLQGRRFVSTIEVEDGKRLAESLVKTLTGGDRIRARRMRQDFYEFDPTHKLFLAANHQPVIRGTDEGIWRRIKLVPFSVQIPPEEADRELAAKLRAEAAGILAWAVRGCLEWQDEGIRDPPAVTAATEEYRAEMDELADFIASHCEVGAALKVRMPELYAAYESWCKDTGSHQHSMRKLGRLLTERGFMPDKANSTNWRRGLDLKSDQRSSPVP